jgi:hypothetical protein
MSQIKITTQERLAFQLAMQDDLQKRLVHAAQVDGLYPPSLALDHIKYCGGEWLQYYELARAYEQLLAEYTRLLGVRIGS